MPRYRFIYDGWRHGEQHPDDRAALEAVDEAKIDRGLVCVERLLTSAHSDRGGSAPSCSDGMDAPPVEVIWRAESEGEET